MPDTPEDAIGGGNSGDQIKEQADRYRKWDVEAHGSIDYKSELNTFFFSHEQPQFGFYARRYGIDDVIFLQSEHLHNHIEPNSLSRCYPDTYHLFVNHDNGAFFFARKYDGYMIIA